MTTSIRDNKNRGTVGDFLKEKIDDHATLSFVSAYFTIYAYHLLKEKFDGIDHLDFLFGEPTFLQIDPDKISKRDFKIENDKLEVAHALKQRAIAKACADWIREKVSIRSMVKPNFLHGKMYLINKANGRDEAILGSSNFTVNGLGLGKSPNIELNLVTNDRRDLDDLQAWFKEVWTDTVLTEDVKAEVLNYLEQHYADNSPEFIYFKTLFHLFQKSLKEMEEVIKSAKNLNETDVWKTLFDFQKDGANSIIGKLGKYNGCILADSVGLGKTYTALAVIKHFELRNDKVLVLCPKRLRENWTVYCINSKLNPFLNDRFGYDVLSHTDLNRTTGKSGDIDISTLHWGNYDLVVIDESHNFRTDTKSRTDENGNVIQRSRYDRLLHDVIKSGVKTKVLLLSATPVNNQLKDLRNQIHFITGENPTAFQDAASIGIPNYVETLRVAQGAFAKWADEKPRQDASALLNKLDTAFFKLLDALTIARSRKHIKKHYDLAALGNFPVRNKPVSVSTATDTKGEFMSYDDLNRVMLEYKLSYFNPVTYVKPEFKKEYEGNVKNFSQELRENYLIGMMKINFMKRLESSVHSFVISMERTIRKIEKLESNIKMFKDKRADISFELGDLYTEETLLEEQFFNYEELNAFQAGEKLKFPFKHLDVDKWHRDLTTDKAQLIYLRDSAQKVTAARDAKLLELKNRISEKIKSPSLNKDGNPNKKVLVFTAFADTAEYLYTQLKPFAQKQLGGVHIALVTGGAMPNQTTFGRADFTEILMNFSPVSKQREKTLLDADGEIDILIATDCISEGQNLQDCDFLINYDIHWNPVRIIQRFGRIDRIGSRNTSVTMVNFWPTADLDNYINLKARVEARMALVDISATNEDNLLDPDKIQDVVTDELKYRDRQLLKLKEEILDLEDVQDSVSLSDFSLDDFRLDLSRFVDAKRDLLEKSPDGLYAVVPAQPEQNLHAGVVFCLRQIDNAVQNERVNPFQPYYLVYVKASGEVQFTFAHAPKILEAFRDLCAGKYEPYASLCRDFDHETEQGKKMDTYDKLLSDAVRSIAASFKNKMVASLLAGRSGKLISQNDQPQTASDFDLITWLIIK
jgi:SNF2 family DNA or RNA helicase